MEIMKIINSDHFQVPFKISIIYNKNVKINHSPDLHFFNIFNQLACFQLFDNRRFLL